MKHPHLVGTSPVRIKHCHPHGVAIPGVTFPSSSAWYSLFMHPRQVLFVLCGVILGLPFVKGSTFHPKSMFPPCLGSLQLQDTPNLLAANPQPCVVPSPHPPQWTHCLFLCASPFQQIYLSMGVTDWFIDWLPWCGGGLIILTTPIPFICWSL